MSDDQPIFSSPSAQFRSNVRRRVIAVDSDSDGTSGSSQAAEPRGSSERMGGMAEEDDEDDGTLVSYGPESDGSVPVQRASAARNLALANHFRDSPSMDSDGSDDQFLHHAPFPRYSPAQETPSVSPPRHPDAHVSDASDRGTPQPVASSSRTAARPFTAVLKNYSSRSPTASDDNLPWSDDESEDKPLYRFGGSLLAPVRDASVSEALTKVEEKLAGQIARALHDPTNEGLHSATFDTLIREYLLPRLCGKDCDGQPYALEQYSQLAALRELAPLPPGKAEVKERKKMQKEDEDEDIAARCVAAKDRRLPDMTSMVIFKTTKLVMDGRYYLLTTRIGPKLAMTEIKSFEIKPDVELDNVLETVLMKAHFQNERAAVWLFGEDEKLHHIASFVGAGPAWSYGEFDRLWYYDVLGKPWPDTAREVEEFEERDFLAAHRKEHREREERERLPKKRKLARSTRETSYMNTTHHNADYDPEQETDPSSDSIDNAATADGGVNDHRMAPKLGVHTPLPAPVLAPLFRGSAFLYILDEEGRTRQAFDIIVKQIRGWYKDREDEYRLNFDADPHTP